MPTVTGAYANRRPAASDGETPSAVSLRVSMNASVPTPPIVRWTPKPKAIGTVASTSRPFRRYRSGAILTSISVSKVRFQGSPIAIAATW